MVAEQGDTLAKFMGLEIKITDLFLVVFSFVLTVFTGLLWRTTHLISKHTMAAERAYVKMSHRSPPGLTIDINSNEVWVVIEIKNSGRTPADVTNVLLSWLVLLKGQSPPAVPNYPPPENTGALTTAFLVANDSVRTWRKFDDISGDHLAKSLTHNHSQ